MPILGLNQGAYKRRDDIELGENVSRTEVLFSNVAAQVMSWTDTEIVVRVPHRNLYGVGKRNEFFNEPRHWPADRAARLLGCAARRIPVVLRRSG